MLHYFAYLVSSCDGGTSPEGEARISSHIDRCSYLGVTTDPAFVLVHRIDMVARAHSDMSDAVHLQFSRIVALSTPIM